MSKTVRTACLALLAALAAAASAHAADPPSFNTVKIAGEPGKGSLPWTEPRIAVGPDNSLHAVYNDDDDVGTAVVANSNDGGKTFKKSESPIAGQVGPTP